MSLLETVYQIEPFYENLAGRIPVPCRIFNPGAQVAVVIPFID